VIFWVADLRHFATKYFGKGIFGHKFYVSRNRQKIIYIKNPKNFPQFA
jgi:hypothetical protein